MIDILSVAVLMGRLATDPELRHTTSDIAATSFTIMVDRSYVKPGVERQADLIDTVAQRSTAEFACKYFRKGQSIVVQGSIQTRSYQDKDGNKHEVFEIVADNVHFMESKREGGTPSLGYGSCNRFDVPMPSAPAYTSGNTGDFEEIPTDDDLPL